MRRRKPVWIITNGYGKLVSYVVFKTKREAKEHARTITTEKRLNVGKADVTWRTL